jgi:Flp pilus assembly protein TadB
MSDIKFACPYCHEHITCDAEYCDATIDCPACGNEMIVPRLSASDSTHPQTVLVASPPGPKRPASRPSPTVRPLTEREWTEHTRRFGGGDKTAPLWLLSLVVALITAFVLKINSAGIWPIIICLLAGAVLSAVLMINDLRSAAAYSVLRGLSIILALCVFVPLIAIGILFVGCMGCR